MPGGEGGEGAAPSLADPANISVGMVVLATTGLIDAWWEALVLKIDDKGVMTLKWRDYPGNPVFRRRRSQVALLPPESVGL